jgi:hypothetical protein
MDVVFEANSDSENNWSETNINPMQNFFICPFLVHSTLDIPNILSFPAGSSLFRTHKLRLNVH